MYHHYCYTLLLIGSLWACTSAPSSDTAETAPTDPVSTETTTQTTDPAPTVPSYVAQLEKAHNKADFVQKKVIQFDLMLSFGGRERFNGTITALTNSTQARLDGADGNRILYKDDVVYAPAALATEERKAGTRFGAYTWVYFFLFPYKLSDPGTNWADYPTDELNGTTYDAQKLTFEAGTGDDPNDWYITYARPDDHLIEVAAYIVTAGGTSQAEAEEDPHAVKYSDYKLVDGIPIAHQWSFWGWRTEAGLTDQLGEATISNVRFLEEAPALFEVPEGHQSL